MTRRALVVGINQYPAPYTLHGCVPDAQRWADVLTARRFAVTRLTDGDATRAAILAALTALVRESRPGDALAFVYSGHGTQLPDRDGDEGDRWDEAIVPVDFLAGQYLVDDDLRAVFDALPAGVGLTCLFDSCFSGTVTRLLGGNVCGVGARPRYLVAPRETLPACRPSDGPSARASGGARAVPAAGAAVVPAAAVPSEALRWVTLSACLPTEVAWEDEGTDGTPSGVFTRAATGVLRAAGPTLTHAGFLRRVLAVLGETRPQTPTYDGPADAAKRTLVSVPKGAPAGAA